MGISYNKYILLAGSLILWCFIHSAMINTGFVNWVKRRFRNNSRYYRIFYNLIATLSLLPIFLLWRSIPAISYFDWPGPFAFIRWLLVAVGLFFLIAGARHYDGKQFLGIRQILSNKHGTGLGQSGGLQVVGILKITRHPWYLAGLVLLWSRNINSVSLIVNIIFSAYLILGAVIEEKKLRREFGAAYIEYQSKVSMFLPVKWLKLLWVRRL